VGAHLRCLTSSRSITSIWGPRSGYWILNARPRYPAPAFRFSPAKGRGWKRALINFCLELPNKAARVRRNIAAVYR